MLVSSFRMVYRLEKVILIYYFLRYPNILHRHHVCINIYDTALLHTQIQGSWQVEAHVNIFLSS